MFSVFKRHNVYIVILLLSVFLYSESSEKIPGNNPVNDTLGQGQVTRTEKLFFEIENPDAGDDVIREHLLDIFPIISEKEIYNIIQTKYVAENKQTFSDSLSDTGVMYRVSFEVPENYLTDTAKILWKLNIPEFQSKIYQLYDNKQIYIDTWPNVVGTIKDKTYTGNFQAYKIRNWPFYKDPDPAKASLPPVKPGPGNPLGLFVVHYDENSLRYFHGTNNPKVLNNQLRNLSHGCVRNDNDNIDKMKRFIVKRVVKSKDLTGWIGSKKSMVYEFEETDKFPVQIVYKTFEVDNDIRGKYIMLFKDVYNYKNVNSINEKYNDTSLITLTTKENIISDYRKYFGSDIKNEPLSMMVEYVINNGNEYEKYYFEDLKEKFMLKY
ncbi:MAG: L,D-transpeptidase family protein [Bacteroidetes bacterium]|nr:L,D-transpeptidase family protein [Bacteroidota bacterium]